MTHDGFLQPPDCHSPNQPVTVALFVVQADQIQTSVYGKGCKIWWGIPVCADFEHQCSEFRQSRGQVLLFLKGKKPRSKFCDYSQGLSYSLRISKQFGLRASDSLQKL